MRIIMLVGAKKQEGSAKESAAACCLLPAPAALNGLDSQDSLRPLWRLRAHCGAGLALLELPMSSPQHVDRVTLTPESPVDSKRRIIDAHHHLWSEGEGLAGSPAYLCE